MYKGRKYMLSLLSLSSGIKVGVGYIPAGLTLFYREAVKSTVSRISAENIVFSIALI